MSGTVKKLFEIENEQLRVNVFPDFQTGDTVGVYYKIREGEKERIQLFEGICVQRHNGGLRSTFTVRKVSNGIGVERVFPLHSPRIDKLEVKMKGKVRQARLQYLRERSGKSARIRERGTI